MELKIVEVNNAQKSAQLVAEDIAQQLQKRGSFRRTIKRTLDQVMESGVKGVKVELAGRLGGSEMSRREKASRGSIPLSTLQRHIDYGFAVARTTVGVIGVKAWIDLGDYRDEETTDGAHAKAGQAPKASKRAHKR
jgi:small subunit ribosomal protein S3